MKEEHVHGYRFFRTVVGFFYKLYYKPTIINKEAIPKEGPIIICGNHIHLFDQNTACISTDRMIHYMAKKEHLEGPFGWFFKLSGCISVNREIHDQNAKNHALDLLNNGYALGLFPEGTRNQVSGKKEVNKKLYELYKNELNYKDYLKILKDNQVCVSEIMLLDILLEQKKITKEEYKDNALNASVFIEKLLEEKRITEEEYDESLLLPLKFGAVSMAQKTGATIIPVITTGKYIFKNNHLNSRFGNPIKVPKDMNLEEANELLRKEMVRLKKEGLKDIKEGKI
mgnify:FL=1